MRRFLIILGIFVILIALRIHFLDEPFERDEGGYGYMAWRLLNGEVMYGDYWDSKPPGIVFIYAAMIKLFGMNLTAVRVCTLYLGLITAFLIYLLGEKMFGTKAGLLSMLVYAIFSGGPLIQGSSSNAEPFMVIFSIIGVYLYLLSEERPIVLLLAGIFFGLAFMVKQTAFDGFLAVAICILMAAKKPVRNILPIIVGFIVAWVPISIYLIKNRVFGEFIHAAYVHNLLYVGRGYGMNWFERFRDSFLYITRENSLLWLLGVSGFLMVKNKILPRLWLFFSVAGIFLGGRFFAHYYIQAVPALAILSGYSLTVLLAPLEASTCQTGGDSPEPVVVIPDKNREGWPLTGFDKIKSREFWQKGANIFAAAAIVFLVFLTVLNQYKYYFVYSPYEVCRLKYPAQDFVSREILAKKIKEITKANDYVYVWGSEPEIYFYSQRKCPVRYINNHFMHVNPVLSDRAKKETMDALNAKMPKVIVPADSLSAFPELNEFIKAHYKEKQVEGGIIFYSRGGSCENDTVGANNHSPLHEILCI